MLENDDISEETQSERMKTMIMTMSTLWFLMHDEGALNKPLVTD